MRYLIFILLLGFYSTSLHAQDDSIAARIVIIGDAGYLVNGRAPVMDAVRKTVPLDSRTSVIYVGDNLYKEGLPDEQDVFYTKYRSILDSQAALVMNTPSKAYFIPGNHDWNNGGPEGLTAILRQQQYLDNISKDNVKFYPEGGCPGPVEVKITDDVIMIIMDSQWWLHPGEKPGIESDCQQKTKEEVLVEIEDILSKNDRKLVLFAAHHPFKSYGVHGGYFTLKQHIFPLTDIKKQLYIPLPLIGSIYPISRSVFGSSQDLPHPTYFDMINRVQQVVKQHHHTIFMHGHEHTLQYIVDSSFNYIISGSGCKTSRVEKGRQAEFVASRLGFALLEISKNKNVHLKMYTIEDSVHLAYSKNIKNFATPPPIEDTIARTVALLEYRDSVLAPASIQYRKNKAFRRLILGNNYRDDWSTPVMFREFNINTERGGFTIEGRGGGKQTKSLSLLDKNGEKWALRTIDKDPEMAIPENLRNGPARDIVQDMISASYPYAPLIVPTLAKAVGVRQADPEVFFVPDDPSLGYYRKLFSNKIAFLERKDPVPAGVETKSSGKVFNNLIEKGDHVIDQKAVLKARLLDILIGDFDRHMDQWKWAELDTGKGKIYSPIAKDRDQAFFYSDGLAVEWISRRRMPFLRGFRYKIAKVNWLGHSARDFDRVFMTGLEKREWEQTINTFTNQMTDSVIDAAVRKLPREVYPVSGDTIAAKLKSRRDLLPQAAMKYYKFLAKDVNILGSNKQEFFYVDATDSGTRVKVYAREPEGDTTMLVYERMFDPKITKELRLYGFNGSDRFEVSGRHGIRLRMIGGRGNDTFNVAGKIKSFVYDLNTEANALNRGGRTKDRMNNDPSVNAFDLFDYQYDIKRYPRVNFGVNAEDGLM
ncbi:MAG: metallophosphoesterase, partial [Sphingobacteriales bacterium]